MNYTNLLKLGGTAMLLKGTADRIAYMGNRRRIAAQRRRTKHLLIGATIGTAAGAVAGLLFAPQAGRKTRYMVAQRTGETIDTVRDRVSSAGESFVERIQEKSARLRDAA